MPDRPRFSRFRRLPGLYRIGDVKPPDPNEEPQPLTVYLPGRILDLAEALAAREGTSSVQEYCEALLRDAIEDEDAARRAERVQVTRGTLDSLDDLASDPDYLAEWSASREKSAPPDPEGEVVFMDGDASTFARESVFRHAGLADREDPSAFLPSLRRGDVVSAEAADGLLAALRELEGHLREASALDRRLAYALHRLAFEGQVLLTDSPTSAANDPATVDRLRRVQEAVDRVLSGEDIRYFPEPDEPR